MLVSAEGSQHFAMIIKQQPTCFKCTLAILRRGCPVLVVEFVVMREVCVCVCVCDACVGVCVRVCARARACVYAGGEICGDEGGVCVWCMRVNVCVCVCV